MPVKPSVKVGDIFTLNCGSIAKVLKYNGCYDIIIETDYGYIGSTHANLLRAGQTTDWNYPSYSEVGFIGFNPKEIRNYSLVSDISFFRWKSMLGRCYEDAGNSIVCDEWLSFKNFKKWCDKHFIEGYHLDKDLGGLGLKIYSPKYCNFVPQEINKLFINQIKQIIF